MAEPRDEAGPVSAVHVAVLGHAARAESERVAAVTSVESVAAARGQLVEETKGASARQGASMIWAGLIVAVAVLALLLMAVAYNHQRVKDNRAHEKAVMRAWAKTIPPRATITVTCSVCGRDAWAVSHDIIADMGWTKIGRVYRCEFCSTSSDPRLNAL